MSNSNTYIVNGNAIATKFIPTGSSTSNANGMYLAAVNQIALKTNAQERLRVDSSGRVGISNGSPAVSLDIFRTDAVRIPVGTSAQRPGVTASTGMVRYNTTIRAVEFYNSVTSAWVALGAFIVATGGTVSTITVGSDTYRVHTFTSVGTTTFEILAGSGIVEYLVVAGGGGGQGGTSGGGGAGGYRCSVSGESSGGGASAESALFLSPGSYSVTVGSGGTAGTDAVSGQAGNGGNSVFHTITSIGGGQGGGFFNTGSSSAPPQTGGSGGGGQNYQAPASNGAAGTAGQGFAGGNPPSPAELNFPAGGGGGAGGAGVNGGSAAGLGVGGIGVQSSINGTATFRGGGGGSGANGRSNAGGLGGGGAGGNGSGAAGNGAANTGGGGGGGYTYASGVGGGGGSGIVIVRYKVF
jgi:hypothetical protein